MVIALDFCLALLLLLVVAPVMLGALMFAALVVTAGYAVAGIVMCYSYVARRVSRSGSRSGL